MAKRGCGGGKGVCVSSGKGKKLAHDAHNTRSTEQILHTWNNGISLHSGKYAIDIGFGRIRVQFHRRNHVSIFGSLLLMMSRYAMQRSDDQP